MTPPVAVIDTNVVVSGLLTREPQAPTAVILDGMLAARFTYLLSLDLLREYREVLLRPAIRRHHGLAERDVDAVLRALALNASVRDPPPAPDSPPDAGDRHVWALLADDPAAVLVTGDEVLIRSAPEPGRVLSPRRFLARLR